ncbi:MAG: hypothetical protein WD052_11655 [Bacteroidales bacterium]
MNHYLRKFVFPGTMLMALPACFERQQPFHGVLIMSDEQGNGGVGFNDKLNN